MSISFGEGIEGITVKSEPKAIFPGYISFVQDGQEVGTISAVFDFEGLHPDLHMLALQIIQQHATRIALPSTRRKPCPASPVTDQKQLPHPSLWSKVKHFFAGTAEPVE